MTAVILDGKQVAQTLQLELKNIINAQCTHKPSLAVILVGTHEASQIYVNHKIKACQFVGIESVITKLDESIIEDDLIKQIHQLNNDDAIHGILVQLPLPRHINLNKIIESINPAKDVDGFHPYHLGRLAKGNPSFLRPCTPYGIIQLLNYYNYSLYGKHVVVVGTSNIVGRPMILECLLAKATVTACHSATQNIEKHIEMADIVIVATGNYDVIKAGWFQPHQIIIDVGIHRDLQGNIHGDIDFATAVNKVQAITPVPGGIGPMTITALLQNTVQAALKCTL